MQLVCPDCGAKNRVPDERLYAQPLCGKCKTQLMAAIPATLSEAALPGFVQGTELPVLVDFWATWCGPCQTMAPQFAEAARQATEIRFAKVDSDSAPQASARYAIRSIPTLVLFKHGREIARQSGAMAAAQILAWARRELALHP
ncbi:thioredoxin TrxC [Craterilacuibacter sp. RT1T]|uniref:thioredoxin TrxC n=1 Tax=Craterilacuibacter sp. RT1T TaxID=2942211 RepID=UPI0020BF1E14|nr:thioredoxin TrxC [Craterilacuibacter sp. RT1T]MCL6262543.1 thioredoxin TrxC [Craterilacuibacter sp. RT1T]